MGMVAGGSRSPQRGSESLKERRLEGEWGMEREPKRQNVDEARDLSAKKQEGREKQKNGGGGKRERVLLVPDKQDQERTVREVWASSVSRQKHLQTNRNNGK